jgi:hypothetical protein
MATESEKDLLPNYLKASTPELLRALMLENNLRLHSFVRYQDMQELKDGSWICWFYENAPEFKSIAKMLSAKRVK